MSNKNIRDRMIEKFGEICMMEQSGIRCIPVEERRTIKGYRVENELITYHHIKPKSKGGKETEENGLLLKWYNHRWLHSQPASVIRKINARLKKYKQMLIDNMKLMEEITEQNAGVKEQLIELYGDGCMIEQIEENYIPQILRQDSPKYSKKEDELVPYKDEYLIKGYNLRHLKQQTPQRQQEIEKAMHIYKRMVIAKLQNGKVGGQVAEFDMTDCIEIPLHTIQKQKEEDLER